MSARFHLRFRYFEMVKYPDERIYTFWDYFRDHYGRDRGLRIDRLLLSPALGARVTMALASSFFARRARTRASASS
jgi:exonuclease III